MSADASAPTHAPNDPKAIVHQLGPGRLGHLKCRACGETRSLGNRTVPLAEYVNQVETFARTHKCAQGGCDVDEMERLDVLREAWDERVRAETLRRIASVVRQVADEMAVRELARIVSWGALADEVADVEAELRLEVER